MTNQHAVPSPFAVDDFFHELSIPGTVKTVENAGLDDTDLVTHENHIAASGKPEWQSIGVPVHSVPDLLTGTFSQRNLVSQLSAYQHSYHRVDFTPGADSNTGEAEARPEADLGEADVIASQLLDENGQPTGYHTIALDIDYPARLVPSSTPGHYHLYIDAPVAWDDYKIILDALGNAGVIEPGYANASIDRGATYLRLPWVSKDDTPQANLATTAPPASEVAQEMRGVASHAQPTTLDVPTADPF